jgi:ribosome-binding protein aMBF1 (putative translation factor)
MAVHVLRIIAHHQRNYDGMPNLSRNRQDPVLVALGEAIRRVRLSKDIFQEKLALLAEVDRSYVGRVERGDNNVAVLTLARLAGALDISIAKLMKEAGL